PAGCQPWVIRSLAKLFAMRLMMGTTCSPSLTARLPPGRKQFCTSMTSSAEASSGLISAAQSADGARAATDVAPKAVRTRLRESMVRLPGYDPDGEKVSSICVRTKARKFGAPCKFPEPCKFPQSAPRMNSVADRAEARKGLGPVVARRRADDAHRGLGAEP